MAMITQPLLLETPLISDSDATPASQILLYWALGPMGATTNWPGAVLVRSTNLTTFATIGSGLAKATWGVATNALPAPNNLWTWDTSSIITINVINNAGELTGASDINVLNGANLGALITSDGTVELIQWANATVVGKTANLSRLLRGVRGTDYAISKHAAGDRFVVLGSALKHSAFLTSEIGLTRWYKATTSGVDQISSPITAKAFIGASSKPYAPIRVNAIFDASNNLIISWLRQTRVGGDNDWQDGVSDAPLSETAESYEVDILANDGSVKRTISELSLPTAVYPRSTQTADFGTPPSSFSIVVYQISSAVGRGFGRTATVPVAWPPALSASYEVPAAGSITLDASSNTFFRITLTSNITSLTVNGGTDRKQITIVWVQDGVGNHAVTFPSNFEGGSQPTAAPNTITAQSFLYDAPTASWNPISGGGGSGGGTTWFTGAGAPVTLHSDGDFWLNVTNGDVYEQSLGAWTGPLGNIMGPRGANGTDGTNGTNGTNGINGAQWYVGVGAPSTLHTNGDFYVNSSNDDVYEQISGAWSLSINIKGAQGNPGIAVGTIAPSSPSVGDLWVDTN